MNTLSYISLCQKGTCFEYPVLNPEKRQVTLRVPHNLLSKLPEWIAGSSFEPCDVMLKGVAKSSYQGSNYETPIVYLDLLHSSQVTLQSEDLIMRKGVISSM